MQCSRLGFFLPLSLSLVHAGVREAQVENSSGYHGFASSMVMHDVTRGAATRLSTSTFDVRGSLVKALPSKRYREYMDLQAFHSHSLSTCLLFSR